MNVVAVSSFNKDLSRIKHKSLATKVEKVIKKIENCTTISLVPGIKKLSGSSNAYRIRIGDYRLGFFLVNNNVFLTIFAHRKEIYRKFP
ncbi:MAG TPA: hypothetical protein VJY62_21655 [Bacteroidia bacterium]|nr:hypothetical protein [Bacteroidia bacterium]